MAIPSSPSAEKAAAVELPSADDKAKVATTCHQCRQSKVVSVAVCKNERGHRGKPCPIRYCNKCLLNRYGEKVEEVSEVKGWCCPKCRGVCNCSLCMKKRGQQPTGMLVVTAKATGFSSVLEMLQHRGMKGLDADKKGDNAVKSDASLGKLHIPSKELKHKLEDKSTVQSEDVKRKATRGSDTSSDKLHLHSPSKKLKQKLEKGSGTQNEGAKTHGALDSAPSLNTLHSPTKELNHKLGKKSIMENEAAKTNVSGFSSVLEMLQHRGMKGLDAHKKSDNAGETDASFGKVHSPSKELKHKLKRKSIVQNEDVKKKAARGSDASLDKLHLHSPSKKLEKGSGPQNESAKTHGAMDSDSSLNTLHNPSKEMNHKLGKKSITENEDAKTKADVGSGASFNKLHSPSKELKRKLRKGSPAQNECLERQSAGDTHATLDKLQSSSKNSKQKPKKESNSQGEELKRKLRKGSRAQNECLERQAAGDTHATLDKLQSSSKNSKQKPKKESNSQGEDVITKMAQNLDASLDKLQSSEKELKWELKFRSNAQDEVAIHENESPAVEEDDKENVPKRSFEKMENSYIDAKSKIDGNISGVETTTIPKVFKPKRMRINGNFSECTDLYVVLPQGTGITTVAGAELLEEDVGPALQFVEFCYAFQKVLNIKKGHSEAILRELSRGRLVSRGLNSLIVQFHIKLLSMISKDGKQHFSRLSSNVNSWLQALGKCMKDSQHSLKEVSLDFINKGINGYNNMNLSNKLKILNFLCDEVLETERLRGWIDKENTKFVEKIKEFRENVQTAKDKERQLNQQLRDVEIQKILSLGETVQQLPDSKHDNTVKEIKKKAEEARADILNSQSMINKSRRPDSLRTEPVLLDALGRAFWRLKGHANSSSILLQDVGNLDLVAPQDKWFAYDEDEEKAIEKHISFVKNLRLKRHRGLRIHVQDIKDDDTKDNCI